MAYGTVKVDTVTFTYNSGDTSTTFSGLHASTTNNLTLSGTATAATFTGTTANFTNVNAQNISVTTSLSGLAITGGTAGFTTITGTTVTGTTANFVTVSGTSITGGTAGFTIVTGTTVTGTTANFVTLSGTTVTGNIGQFTSLTSATTTMTSGVFASGTEPLPSISFVSDPNTGIYSPGADQLAVATNGIGRLFVDANGNIGVGTSSPANYANFVTLALADSSGAEIDFVKGSTVQSSLYNASDIFYIESKSTVPTAFVTNGSERLRITSTGTLNFKGAGTAGSTQAVSFNGSAPVDSLVIDSSGRLGIGTSNPNKPLHIYSGSSDSEIRLQSNSGTEQNAYFTLRNSGGKLDIYSVNGDIALNPGNSVAATFKSDGKVGIGTTSPNSYSTYGNKLVVYGTGTNGPGITIATGAADTGSLYFADGTTGNEAFRGAVQYAHADDSMELHTSGTVKVKITSGGLVGIGTTDARGVLRLAGSSANAFPNNGGVLWLTDTNAATDYKNWSVSSINGEFGVARGSDAFNTGQSAYKITGAVTQGYIGEHIWYTNNSSEKVRIDNSGRLLVGTSNARDNFFNLGVYTAKHLVEGTGGTGSGRGSLAIVNNSTTATDPGYLVFGRTKGSAVNSNTVLAADDWVGMISFQGSDGTQFVECAQISAYVDGTPGADDMPGRLVFSTTPLGSASPTPRMRITNAGDVYIGHTGSLFGNTGSTIGAAGEVQFSASANYPLLLNRNTSDGTLLEIRRGWTTVGSISVTTTATAYNTSSDYRLKENIAPVTDGIARLQQLKPSRFNFIADFDRTVDGFIAHEVQTVVPEAIAGEKDAVDDEGNPVYQGIDQSKLVPLLTAALQEAVAKIETLEQRLTAAGIA